MPSRNYMVVDPRRDHSFRVPRPDLTVKLGTPNACNGCHADQSPQWASEAVDGWYGSERSSQVHFGEALHAGRRALVEAENLLLQVIQNEDESGIARASAVSLLRNHLSPRSLTAIEGVLGDDDPLVRRSAAGLLDALDVQTRWRLGSPLLTDPIRTVRLEAISALANVPADAQIPQRREAFQRAVAEFRETQRFNADRAEAHVNLGNLEAGLGRVTEAEDAYRRAISMQPSHIPAYVNLADLLRATGRDAEGENVLRDALTIAPESAAVHHALGLLLIRQQRLDEALEHLAKSVVLRPDESRYAFVYGIALHDTGEIGAALTVLEQTHAGSPADRNVLQALVSYNMELGNRETAFQWASKLEDLSAPD
jgi:Flp pilus assembly protein TadD